MKIKILFVVSILYFLLIPHLLWAKEEDITVFRVKIVVDQYYLLKTQGLEKDFCTVGSSGDWQKLLSGRIERINRECEASGLRVKLEIAEISSWQIGEEVSILLEALRELERKVDKGECDLVIAFTSKIFPDLEENRFGGYYGTPGYILLKDKCLISQKGRSDWEIKLGELWISRILKHEIGHFFGLGHSNISKSVMHDNWSEDLHQDFLMGEIEFINEIAPRIKLNPFEKRKYAE